MPDSDDDQPYGETRDERFRRVMSGYKQRKSDQLQELNVNFQFADIEKDPENLEE